MLPNMFQTGLLILDNKLLSLSDFKKLSELGDKNNLIGNEIIKKLVSLAVI